jgi:SAM-dependent methyltransferase
MKRRPEPELMDTEVQAEAYAEADFSEPNDLFLRLLVEQNPGSLEGARALDLGCGPADIVVRFLRRFPGATCDALDGSQPMLDIAQADLNRQPELASRARLICDKLPSPRLETQAYDLILSNSLLHHLHDPQVLWRSLPALGRSGALVLIMDLMRPASSTSAAALVERYAGDASPVLRQDFQHSLFAAFEPAEVEQQLRDAGLDEPLEVQVVSDRHLAVWGRLP